MAEHVGRHPATGTERPAHDPIEDARAEVLVLDRRPGGAREDENVLAEDVGAAIGEGLAQPRGQLDDARPTGLGWAAFSLKVDARRDSSHAFGEVDVAPSKGEGLADPAAGVGHEEDGWV